MSTNIKNFDCAELLTDEYIVEKILDKKKLKGIIKYKVKWEGYSYDECTWEPSENLKNCVFMVNQFEQVLKLKKEQISALKNEKIKSNNVSLINNDIELQRNLDEDEPITIKKDKKILLIPEELISSTNIYGNLDQDIPLKILNARIIDNITIELNCLVQWYKRDSNIDDSIPNPSWISSKVLRKRAPEILLDFYEGRLILPIMPKMI